MKASELCHIAKNIYNLPYKSIMFDGHWGIGKSYEIERIFEDNPQSCIISLFGINNCQELFSKILFKLGSRNKTLEQVYKVTTPLGKAFLEHLGVNKAFVDTSKGLTLRLLKKLKDENYIIVFDDLERVGSNFNFEEFLGIVEELRQFSIKVILVANIEKFEGSHADIFSKYHEKVIDKIYKVDQLSSKIDWDNIGVDDSVFTERYIEYFRINNLRTIQKAEQFFKDVKIKIDEGKINIEDNFLMIIKKICYSIVVEDIEKYGKKEFEQKIKESEKTDKSSYSHDFYKMINGEFHSRVEQYYLNELRSDIFDSIIKMLAGYYKNSNGFNIECIEVGIDLYKKMGEKPNFFKSDDELKEMIEKLKKEFFDSSNFLEALKKADIILLWMDVLGIDSTRFFQKMQKALEKLIDDAIEKDVRIDEIHTMFSLENKKLKRDISNIFIIFEKKQFEKYISLIKQFENNNDYGSAYLTIKSISERTWNNIEENKFGELLGQEALPLGSISEEQWILFKELKNLFMQTDCKSKQWNEYIQNAKKKNKDDKVFLHRIRSIEE